MDTLPYKLVVIKIFLLLLKKIYIFVLQEHISDN